MEQKLSRKELKEMVRHDKFAEEVGHTVQYVAGHKKQIIIYAAAAVAVLAAASGFYWYSQKQAAERQAELHQAIRVFDATVGPGTSPYVVTFPTQSEKQKAIREVFGKLATKHSGSQEGDIAHYYLGIVNADTGNAVEAEKQFRAVVDSGEDEYASLAKVALADLLISQNKRDEAEKLLRTLVDNPSVFVSKEQATIELAKAIAPSKPAEARKLLEPLRTERSAVSRAAIEALSAIPNK